VNALRYGDPRAMRQAITDRLRGFARERNGAQLADLQRQFAYDRLLCRVFLTDPDRWVLKGATAMLARLQGVARHTVDVDLYRRDGDLIEAERALRHAADADLGDHFRFTVSPGRLVTQQGRALRVAVTAYVGATDFAGFGVDLSAGLWMTGSPDDVPPLVPIDLPGVVQTRYRAYPLVDHVADKTCALFETYERAGGQPDSSTRYRDLVDLVVFAHTAAVDARALATAISSEFDRRCMALPPRLAVPDGTGWRTGYARAARDAPVLRERDLETALATAARFIDPVLAGVAAGTWDCENLVWVSR
jgi:hypothetical protein